MAVCLECGTNYRRTKESLACPSCGSTRARASGTATAAGEAPAKPKSVARQVAADRPPRAVPAAPAAAPERAHVKRTRPAGAAGEPPVLDDAAKYGLYATLGFGLIVGIVCLFVFRTKAERQRVADEFEAKVKGIHAELVKLDVTDPTAAEKIIKLAGDEETTWREHELAGEIETLVVRARSSLTNSKEKRSAQESFEGIESEIQKGELTSERLKEVRRLLDESEVRLADGGAELVARIALARSQAERLYAERLLADAAAAAAGGTPRAGMSAYQAAEDELKTLLDRAYTSKNAEMQAFYTPLYQQAIAKTDELASALFKLDGENLPWIDCLAPPQASNWNASSVRGFSHRVEAGVMQLIGPDADAGKMAVISIGDREQWRHYQVDMEFTVDAGDIDLFFRLGRGPNQNTLSYPLRTVQSSGVKLRAEKEYSARVSVIGSKFSVRYVGEDIDTPSPYDEDVAWTMNRKGAIGLVLQPGSKAKFTSFKVRELR